MKHFLTLLDLSSSELEKLIENAIFIKESQPKLVWCKDKIMGMLFEKPSTRTRVSFEVGMKQFGGDAIFISSRDSQMGRGEPIEDTAKVLSRMLDIIMIRTFDHHLIEEFAKHSKVPVINGLTNSYHPCQLLADMLTYREHRGSIQGKSVAWVGDGNNMCQSYINAARQFDFQLNIACPEGYYPDAELVKANKNRVKLCRSPKEAVTNSDLVVTDVWASMGDETEKQQRNNDFADYEVNHQLMSYANQKVLLMHCLPAHRGEEISAECLADETISVVWDEAENRIHAQKALISLLLRQ